MNIIAKQFLFTALLVTASQSAVAQYHTPTDEAVVAQQRALHLSAQLRADWARRTALGETPNTIVEPSITAGKVLTSVVDVTKAPGVPAIQLTIAAGTVGVSSLSVNMMSASGLNGQLSLISLPPFPVEPATETVKLQLLPAFYLNPGFGLYAQPGAWAVSGVSLYSADGTTVSYSAASLAGLFPSVVVNVVNSGTPDATPPTVGTGSILTPSVSLSSALPYFAARLAVADNLSGVTNFTIGIVPPGANFPTTDALASITFPIKHGQSVAFTRLPMNSALGTYTISQFTVCDVAQNCLNRTTPADIQAAFGATTFQVTQ